MSFEPRTPFGFVDSASATLAEEGARGFMQRVYAWMTAGLAITGVVALFTASSPSLLSLAMAARFPLTVATLGLVVAFSWLAPRVSGAVAAMMFVAYAALNGVFFSALFAILSLGTISTAFFITAGSFAALSLYGRLTKKNLSAWSTFLFMGLFGVLLAGVVNLFMHSAMLSFVVSAASVVVFAGLTAYDTQKIREHYTYNNFSSVGSLAIVGALTLYLDFVNLFLALLRLLARSRD